MALSGLFVDDSAVEADLQGLAIVTLLRRYECDPAVAVLVVVAVDELADPMTGLVLGGIWLAGVIRLILHRPEQRFRVRVVVFPTTIWLRGHANLVDRSCVFGDD